MLEFLHAIVPPGVAANGTAVASAIATAVGIAVADDELLALAAAVESGSSNPLASAVLEAAKQRELPVAAAEAVTVLSGRGVEARSSQGSETVKRMSAGLLGRRCVIGVDRLDYSKGLVDRFLAYERYMESHPASQNHITFLQIAPLSRADVRAYAEIRHSLEQAAGRINGRFAETDWTPIRYLNRNFSHETLMGFLRNACVGVVTPVRDGMNLVAKEFVAAQDPEDPGMLVLSTLAGAAEELPDALLVNPRDRRAVAEAIHRALSMSRDERRARHERLIEVLRRNDIHAWHGRFVQQLQACVQPDVVGNAAVAIGRALRAGGGSSP